MDKAVEPLQASSARARRYVDLNGLPVFVAQGSHRYTFAGTTFAGPRQIIAKMTALTSSQLDLLRRLGAGDSLYDCKDIPHFLEEIVLLARLGLVAIGSDGSPTVTAQGAAYENVPKDVSEFIPLTVLTPMESPQNLPLVAAPDGPLPLGQVAQS